VNAEEETKRIMELVRFVVHRDGTIDTFYLEDAIAVSRRIREDNAALEAKRQRALGHLEEFEKAHIAEIEAARNAVRLLSPFVLQLAYCTVCDSQMECSQHCTIVRDSPGQAKGMAEARAALLAAGVVNVR
jgi:hypothetical protein